MKILVTGASGNVGHYVVSELKKFNETIRAASSDTAKIHKIFQDEVEAIEFDFTRSETFDEALKGVDRIFLMRPPHLGKPENLYPFIDAAKRYPIQLISFLSLMGVEKNTIPPHHKIEKYIEASGIPFCHIRPGFFMQNVSGIHSYEIKTMDTILIPAGQSKTSFIDAADIGCAIATVLHQPHKHRNTAYTITGPEALDYNQIANILTEVTGRKITYANPGFLRYRKHYIQVRKFDKQYVDVTLALYLMTRLGSAKATTDTFYKLTGKQPRSFETFAHENRDAFIR